MSVVSIIGARRTDGSKGSGTVPAPEPSFGAHCQAPAGLLVFSHRGPASVARKLVSHVIGGGVQTTSRPLVIASLPTPVPKELFQPRPCSSSGAASGSGPTRSAGPAPWVLPKVWPPAISAAV